ncbi:MAG: hypothetical protein HFH90_15490 [Lachnospiraceae bacterium]|nr:hypothetical protein [Lachnospiraceae bacterium]
MVAEEALESVRIRTQITLEKGRRRYMKMKIHMKDDGFDFEANKSSVLTEMKEGYSELREASLEELEKMVQNDRKWENIFLDKLFGRIVEYDPDACIEQE